MSETKLNLNQRRHISSHNIQDSSFFSILNEGASKLWKHRQDVWQNKNMFYLLFLLNFSAQTQIDIYSYWKTFNTQVEYIKCWA